VLVLLGGAAAKTILGMAEGHHAAPRQVAELIGAADRDVATLATLHPAFLLRKPVGINALVWRDLLSMKERLEARMNRMDQTRPFILCASQC
jgi:DNA polymerase